jgi:hypothetical protein
VHLDTSGDRFVPSSEEHARLALTWQELEKYSQAPEKSLSEGGFLPMRWFGPGSDDPVSRAEFISRCRVRLHVTAVSPSTVNYEKFFCLDK